MSRKNAALVALWNNSLATMGKDYKTEGLISCEVDISGDGGLPRLHIVYNKTHFVYFADEAAMVASGIQNWKPEGNPSNHITEKEVSHLWLCNFRRYGWSWTDSAAGEYGYCFGDVWPNGDGGFGMDNAQEFIKASFRASWELGMQKYDAPFGLSAYKPAIVVPARQLLDEALSNEHSLDRAERCIKGFKYRLGEELKPEADRK